MEKLVNLFSAPSIVNDHSKNVLLHCRTVNENLKNYTLFALKHVETYYSGGCLNNESFVNNGSFLYMCICKPAPEIIVL